VRSGILAAAVLAAKAGAGVEETASLVNQPKIVAAMQSAWKRSLHGSIGREAAFRLDGSASEYEVVTAAFTGEVRQLKVRIEAGRTFAVFHVHPNGTSPAPSRQDRELADQYGLLMVTMHRHGLFAYDPAGGDGGQAEGWAGLDGGGRRRARRGFCHSVPGSPGGTLSAIISSMTGRNSGVG